MTIDYTTAYEAISPDIAYNATFASAASAVQSLISQIQDENNAIQGGTSAVTTNMPSLVANLIGNIALCMNGFITTFLTPEAQDCYYAGTCTIDEVVSLELWTYYNTLQKLRLYAQSMQGVINAIPVVDTIRFAASANNYTLTEDEFDTNGDLSNEVENESSFYYYTIMQGDTPRIIAFRELGDAELYIQILRLNNITENDFIDETIIGQQIKIPQVTEGANNGDDNLVYESDTENVDAFMFGTDLSLGDNGEIGVSGSGDLKALTGIENAYQAIEQRVKANKGSLNVFSSDWGTTALDDGNAPLLVKIDRFLTDQLSQIMSDPRVKSADINFDKMVFTGETLSVPTKVYFIGSDETKEVTING